MASSESHRQMVVPEICATMPRAIASRATSCVLQRLKGTPEVAGSSQAMAFTSILTSGGKGRGPARARSIFQPLQALLMESLAPLPDHLRAGVQPRGYLLVGDFFGGQKDDPGANHLPIGGGVRARPLLQDGALLFRRLDAVGALAGHAPSFLGGDRLVEKPYPGAANRTHQRNSVRDHLAGSALSAISTTIVAARTAANKQSAANMQLVRYSDAVMIRCSLSLYGRGGGVDH